MGRLDGKVAIVTGASAGIGQATAALFAREGAKVVLASRQAQAGQKACDEVLTAGGDAVWMRLDVTSEENWHQVVDATVNRFGKLNVLVNNAGIAVTRDVERTSLDDWNLVMGINAAGTFLGMKTAIPAMKASGELCSIINHGSIDGLVAEAMTFAYCASKGAVALMTKSVALAMGRDGGKIRANTIHPGYIHTAMVEKEAVELGISPEDYLAQGAELHPIGFIGEPMDVAYLDVFLASDESRFLTGADLPLDGGYTAQ